MSELKVIVSGGGTGGHIFPAISIANAVRELRPDAKILFVGAEGRMEMQRVPAAGYEIVGLPVQGFDRKNLLKNIPVLIKLFKSQRMARKIVKDFRPHAAVGVGGYASGPTLKVAGSMGIPTLLQEQNSYPETVAMIAPETVLRPAWNAAAMSVIFSSVAGMKQRKTKSAGGICLRLFDLIYRLARR